MLMLSIETTPIKYGALSVSYIYHFPTELEEIKGEETGQALRRHLFQWVPCTTTKPDPVSTKIGGNLETFL